VKQIQNRPGLPRQNQFRRDFAQRLKHSAAQPQPKQRRIVFCRIAVLLPLAAAKSSASGKYDIPPNAIRRYSRLQICATPERAAGKKFAQENKIFTDNNTKRRKRARRFVCAGEIARAAIPLLEYNVSTNQDQHRCIQHPDLNLGSFGFHGLPESVSQLHPEEQGG